MSEDTQVLYLGRWVSREHFRAFVYNKEGKKLVNSYDEFSKLISSGIWEAEPIKANFNQPELLESKQITNEENNIVAIKPKRGRKCQNLNKV